ncbi:MAG TPA: hypothetical protein VHD63_04415, partial [Ktedonobacteraceae bacterium]|nr:hypothetical protein [Ktedonobacteraceae bacterium]
IDLFDANAFMRRRKAHIVEPENNVLENILIAMLVECTLRKEEKNMSLLYDTVAEIHPVGAALGKRLFVQEQLPTWSKQHRSASFVFNELLYY